MQGIRGCNLIWLEGVGRATSSPSSVQSRGAAPWSDRPLSITIPYSDRNTIRRIDNLDSARYGARHGIGHTTARLGASDPYLGVGRVRTHPNRRGLTLLPSSPSASAAIFAAPWSFLDCRDIDARACAQTAFLHGWQITRLTPLSPAMPDSVALQDLLGVDHVRRLRKVGCPPLHRNHRC